MRPRTSKTSASGRASRSPGTARADGSSSSANSGATIFGSYWRLFDWLIPCGLALLTAILFFPNTSNDFSTVDDYEYVSEVEVVTRGLTLEGVYWAFTSPHFANWLPVTTLSHMLDNQLYGLDSFGHHLTNVLLHALNAALVYVMLLYSTARRWPSLVVAALFAVHPLRVESVAWIAERKDLLAGTFFLLTVIAYVAWVRRPAIWRYILILVLLSLGLMSKTMLVTVPCVLLLLDWWPLKRVRIGREKHDSEVGNRRSVGRLVVEKLPMLLPVIAAAGWTIILQRSGGALGLTAELTLWQRLANAIVCVPRYLGKLILPINLTPYYSHPEDWSALVVMLAALLVVLISVGVVWTAGRRPYLLVGWCWFLGMLFPVSGVLIHAGRQSMADRYTYLPGLGLLIAIVWFIAAWVGDRTRWKVAAACTTVVALLLLSSRTERYQRVWQNDMALYTHALQVEPKNWFALQVVGHLHMGADNSELAIDFLRRSLQSEPNNDRIRLELATLLLSAIPARAAEASEHFRIVATNAPQNLIAWVGLARAESSNNRPAAADAAFAEASRRWPLSADIPAHWALALVRQQRLAEAREKAEIALKLDPKNEAAAAALKWVQSAPTTKPIVAPH